MNQEELKQRLIELVLTDVECDKDGHGDCSMCEYSYSDDNCFKYYSGVMTDFLIANGVTIRERGEWKDNTFCSRCGYFAEDDEGHILMSFDEFCPFCGADMRGVKDE